MTRFACRLAAAVAAGLALVGSGWAQSSATCTLGSASYTSFGAMGKTGSPYSAVLKTTFEQTLPDGNSIHAVSRAHQARDSSGKTLNEIVMGCLRGQDGQLHARLTINVNDTVTKTNTSWVVDEQTPKIVHILHFGEHVPVQLTPEQRAGRQNAAQIQHLLRNEFSTEDLGTKTISGVLAKGSRSVRTIPAGEEGNELPLKIVTEQWFSQDMGLTLLRIQDDPRKGKTTVELEDLSLTEPDPALFTPPAGYKVEETHPNMVTATQ